MKKHILTAMIILSLAALLAGCTIEIKNAPQNTGQSAKNTPKTSAAAPGSPTAKPSVSAVPSKPSSAPSGTNPQSSGTPAVSQDQINQALQAYNGMNELKTWPTSQIYNVPEWKGVTIYGNSGQGSLDDSVGQGYAMRLEANKDSLNAYLDTLKAAGYKVSESSYGYTAVNGPVTMDIQSLDSSQPDMRWITIELAEVVTGEWPGDLPGFMVPPEGKTLEGKPVYVKPGEAQPSGYTFRAGEDGYNLIFTYSGLTTDEAVAYMKDILAKLNNGEYGDGGNNYSFENSFATVKGTYDWNGQTYNVIGEASHWEDDVYDFSFAWSTGKVK